MADLQGYNSGYLDEQSKRTLRRAILKAVAIPGYQVPFAGREMPMPYGWGTGGIQLTASLIGEEDVLKVIDQGADDTTNAVSIRQFFQRVSGAAIRAHPGSDADPDAAPHSRNAAGQRSGADLSGADPRAAAFYRTARNRNAHHACAGGVRRDAGKTL